MYLDAPAFPVSFPIEKTIELIDSLVKSKYWEDFKVGSLKLIYLPYWVFNYTAYEEKEDKGRKETKELAFGKMSFADIPGELDEATASLYSSVEKETSNTPSEDYPFEVRKAKFSSSDVKEIAGVKLASNLGIAKENVIVSAVEKTYLPIWSTSVTIAEKNYRMEINAVSGEIMNEKEIPEREKGWLDITAETIEELKNPGTWVKYTREVGKSVAPKTGSFFNSFMNDKSTQIIVLGIIAILVILWVFFG